MIRINLLESITDKPASAALAVEKKVSNPKNRFFLFSGVVGGLLVLLMAFDYMSAWSARAAADKVMEEQQQIAKQMESVLAEQAELDKKIKDIDGRIEAIKDLRSKQAGPSAVLTALRERIAAEPGLFLESVEQKGTQLTINGNSPNEYVVTSFGRSLEFSSGLFSNLNIETQLKELQGMQVFSPTGAPVTPPAAKSINFKIVCAYTPNKAAQPSSLPNGQTAGNQPPAAVSAPNAPAGAAPQTVKQ